MEITSTSAGTKMAQPLYLAKNNYIVHSPDENDNISMPAIRQEAFTIDINRKPQNELKAFANPDDLSDAEWDSLMKEAYDLASKTLAVTRREIGHGGSISFHLPSDYRDNLSEQAKKHIDVFDSALYSFRNIIGNTTFMEWNREDKEYFQTLNEKNYAKIAATPKDGDKDSEDTFLMEAMKSSIDVSFARFSGLGEGYVNRMREMWNFGLKQTINSFTDLSNSSAKFLNGFYDSIMKKIDDWQKD